MGYLIDSILSDIDIPKLYFSEQKNGEFDVIDGQQRLWTIWSFLSDKFEYSNGKETRYFSQLTHKEKMAILNYELQITIFQNADEEYLRKTFLRLQISLALITGEKLNALTGKMRELVFKELVKHPFICNLGIPKSRFNKETLCAQIAINSFSKVKHGKFVRTRYEDLEAFFITYANPKGVDLNLFNNQTPALTASLDFLNACFGRKAKDLRNRSYVLTIHLFIDHVFKTDPEFLHIDPKQFSGFVFHLWDRLREEAKEGIDRTNKELYSFQSSLSSAPGEQYQIDRRHDAFCEFFLYYTNKNKLPGD